MYCPHCDPRQPFAWTYQHRAVPVKTGAARFYERYMRGEVSREEYLAALDWAIAYGRKRHAQIAAGLG